MGNNYDLLIAKINEFTKKFYLNKLLRGSIYAAATILGLYLILFVVIWDSIKVPNVELQYVRGQQNAFMKRYSKINLAQSRMVKQ